MPFPLVSRLLPVIGVAIRAVRIRIVDPRTKRIGRSAPRIECWHARRIVRRGYDTKVFLYRTTGMCARRVAWLVCCKARTRNRKQNPCNNCQDVNSRRRHLAALLLEGYYPSGVVKVGSRQTK